MSHFSDPENGPLSNLISYLNSNPSTQSLAHWMSQNLQKVIGLLFVIPVYVILPQKHKYIGVMVSIFSILILPPASSIDYLVMFVSLSLYYKLKVSSHKIYLVVFNVLLYMLGLSFTSKGVQAPVIHKVVN
uniref:ORF3 n=1 Tax=Negevirus sp. TaxID=2585265 RepID=A0A9Y1G868_9VIRU|nr:ORF3 [Negevirus sp.]